MDTTITIPVPPELAERYNQVSDSERARIQTLLQQELNALLDTGADDLLDLMRLIGERAQARGLTSDILQDLLRDDE
jgi:hypothetical protein